MSVNQEFNNNRFRFKMPTNQVSAANNRPIWNVGSIQSINIESSTPTDGNVLYYDATSQLWKSAAPAASSDVEAIDGTVAAPSISFASDLDTGLYRIGDNNVGVTTGGTLRFDISTTAVTSAEPIIVSDTTASTNKDTGSIVTEGGVGIELGLNVGGSISSLGTYVGGVTSSSGPGAVSVTGQIHEITTTGTGDALTLADGIAGQMLRIIYVAEAAGADTAILTPTTLAGATTITFNNLGEGVNLVFSATGGWHIVGAYGVIVA